MKNLINDIGKKKLIIIIGAFVGFIILIIILLLVIHALNSKSLTYNQVETKLTEAAKKYYTKNKDLLPQNDGGQTSVDDVTLTASDCLKPIGDLINSKEGVVCTGKVLISYVSGKYRYTPLLNCGDNYKTETLVSYITKNENRVFEGQGLYDMNGELIYRGENPNNYIKFSNKLYRIVKIVDNKAVIILNERFARGVWDDRYNIDRNRDEGINDYSVSRMKTRLSEILNEGNLISKNDQTMLFIHDLYIGKRSETDNYNDGTIEKSTIDSNQYIGLLPLYDYINASIDGLCESAITKNCSNYNYLGNFDYDWWTITGDSSISYRVYKVTSGMIESSRTSSNYFIRPVVMLVDSTLYAGGTGTETDPYLVK